MIFKHIAAATALLLASAPAIAASDPPIATPPTVRGTIPAQLSPSERTTYRTVFAAIRAGDWSAADAGLTALPEGLLHPVARAELYLAKGSPKVDGTALTTLLTAHPELPQAARLLALAKARGVSELPALPYERDFIIVTGPSRRGAARTTTGDAAADAMAATARQLIVDNRPSDAEALLTANMAILSIDALTEWRQRIAWGYYIVGDDAAARRLAGDARKGMGPWAVQADWVAGLAAWRQNDCAAASDAFSSVASRARDGEMMAAGLFWAARADIACGHPERVQARLRSAARIKESFYGLIAAQALGVAPAATSTQPDFIQADWTTISGRPNARVAAALTEIGEIGLADRVLRHQAGIGNASDHNALLRLAARLNLPATQFWLSRNAPAGVTLDAAARYPAPQWAPARGWRVDKALVFAHALQESGFATDAVSRAGARGLMQIMPGTAKLIASHNGLAEGRLDDPSFNIECGQSYLEQLRDQWATGGLLPKVIAAYNAGPMAVAKWNDRLRDQSDPLLYIESIPYKETRAYVVLVLRNYWMYQEEAGARPASLAALTQGLWPRFPGMPGATAVRLDQIRTAASAD